jgi:small subunit ribosomal protein S4
MGRYTGPKERLSRREGQNLFLKGLRSHSDKAGIVRRPQAPGQHGTSKRRLSDYGIQLREKQKVKRMYGLTEKQFRNYYENAVAQGGVTGEVLLSSLESRLDTVVYKLGIATSRAQARQWVTQGKFLINGKKINIPSYALRTKDKITTVADFKPQVYEGYESPAWLKWDSKKNEGVVLNIPTREDIKEDIEEYLIVEFYSR